MRSPNFPHCDALEQDVVQIIRRTAAFAFAWLMAAWLPIGSHAMAADIDVLVLYSNNRLVPGNIAVDRGLRSSIRSSSNRHVQIFSEFLDRPDFGGAGYESTVVTYLREKYSTRAPTIVIAVSNEAFQFMIDHRSELFSMVPLIHAAVAKSYLAGMGALPADVVGVPREYDFAGTIQQAMRWHPRARKLVIVTGASDRDRVWERDLRRDVPRIAAGLEVEFLAGLPSPTVAARLRALGADSIVFTPGYYEDGTGALFNPRDVAALLAPVSGAPMYGPFDTFIGTGVVGGRMPAFDAMGAQAGEIANAALDGASPVSLHLPPATPTSLRVDWRQVRRWGIDEKDIPADALIYYKEATFWELYHNVALAIALVILLQAGLILSLLLERRRRRDAEIAVQKQRAELAHASRLAMAGELTASIAHEINQPLGAILASADAAELMLETGDARREDLKRIVSRIRRDDLRASDVISRLRTLLAKQEPERTPFDLNEAAVDVVGLLETEARHRHVILEARLATASAQVVGDRTQIQQVLINLLLNAIDAVADLPEPRRTITLSVERSPEVIVVSVRDRGPGIAPDHLSRLFDSFFTTKHKGMGLGLSIARSIVESHGGSIRAENGSHGGALFHVELPAAGETANGAKGMA